MNKHKKFIKDAYSEFGDDIKVGDWVIGKNGYFPYEFRLVSSITGDFVRYNDPSVGEGENNGTPIRFLRKATPAEIEAFLKNEAVRRGFKKGITMLCIEGAIGTEAKFYSDPDFGYSSTLDRLDAHFPSCTFTVYSKGKWAPIIGISTA